MEIIVVGAGQFGSALAHIYEQRGAKVQRVQKADRWPAPQKQGRIVLVCIPTRSFPEFAEQRRASLSPNDVIVSTAKGLIQRNSKTPTDYLRVDGKIKNRILVLSGPSFASELSKGLPAALVLSGKSRSLVTKLSSALSTSQLRIYKNLDPKGVELCGALKNVYAIAAGISDGLELGGNARAALITRALAEMCRIQKAAGGKTLTCFGLAGAGDLFLTCSSPQSRNYRFGYGLARGKQAIELLKTLGTVEGAWTAQVARNLCRRKKIPAPLLETVSKILANEIAPKEALSQLMTRALKHEFE